MKNIISILVVNVYLFFSMVSLSQVKTDAILMGNVKSDGKQIPFVNIIINETNIGTITDATGHYKLVSLPAGKVTVIAQALGYKTREKEINIKSGQVTELFFELEEDVLQLEQVVVTGTMTRHHIKDVPIRTEVITSREIETKNANNLYQALEGTPGIRVEQQCQFCNFTMIRMQGLGAEHTQVLINGQPLYSGLAGVYGLQQIGTADIDRIEVVKGAGSALYGSSAVAGAINIITKEPSFKPTVKASLQFGKYNTNRYDITSSIRNEKGNIGLSIFAQKVTGNAIDETSDGMTRDEVRKEDGISDRVATNLNNAGFCLYTNNIFLNNDKLIVRGRYLYEKRQGGVLEDDYYKNPFTVGTECITTDRYESELTYNKKFNNSEFNLSLAYVKHKRDATNDSYLVDYMETHNDSLPDLRDMRPYLASESSLTVTLTFGTGIKNHMLLAGVQSYYNKLEESGMYVVVDTESDYSGESYRSISNKTATEFGTFLQDEWLITRKLTLVPGIRLDIHNSEEEYKADRQVFETTLFPKTKFDETSINPRIAAKYELSEKITLRINTGTGFRAPYGFSEDLHLCSGSPRVWKSSGLNPEKSISCNFSADYYGKKIRIGTNIFRTGLKDKIAFVDADENISAMGYDYQWKNIDDAFVQGIELSLMAELINDLKSGIDFTYNQGKYDNVREDWKETPYAENSKYISRFPVTTGSIRLEYNPGNWNFMLTGNYQGKMYIDYFGEINRKIKKTSPFILFNLRVSKKLNIFKIYTGIDNIFNYIQDEKHTDDAAFMYAPVYGTVYYGGIMVDLTK
jgi:outer membrane receptor for ferrienterochelin and colicins